LPISNGFLDNRAQIGRLHAQFKCVGLDTKIIDHRFDHPLLNTGTLKGILQRISDTPDFPPQGFGLFC
jgi:hypothetical protein